jgi:hypothetical protein
MGRCALSLMSHFFPLLIQVFELRALCLLGKHPLLLFLALVSQIWSHAFCLGLVPDHDPSTSTSHITGITHSTLPHQALYCISDLGYMILFSFQCI